MSDIELRRVKTISTAPSFTTYTTKTALTCLMIKSLNLASFRSG